MPQPVPAPARTPATATAGPEPIAAGREPIAVVGVAGRYPGARNLDEFWQNLVSGRTSITEVPADRWDWREHFDPRRGRPGHTYSRWAAFIDDVDRFDPAMFGILPSDAAAMDPQERLFLETAWLLLEDAGGLGAQLRHDTGVFVGTMYGSYGRIAAAQGWPEGRYTDGHSAYWSIANRVSYTLDLTGPSFAVDSACSSSLTAVHLACESLRRGECSTAIAGGVNLVLHPAHLIALSSMTMLSADGACKVFDERADGFVPGEGVGAVLLKPLSAAQRDGDRIWGVIEGGFVNAGGRTAGYTVPNPNAQADLVVRALAEAGVGPADVGYLEAHGTGTALGDPIEIAGLAKALGTARPGARPVAVGSVKANIGHLEGAAGIAGLTKVLLQLAHGTIAPCANLATVNPRIDLSGTFVLPTEAQPWTGPRRAGISSFGAGGANTHLVVAGWPAPEPAPVQPGPHVAVLSARTPAQLRALASAVADHVERGLPRLDQLAYTMQVGRAELAHRLAVVVSDTTELVRRLRSGDVVTGVVGADPLFSGDGGAEITAGLLRQGRLDNLAELWVRGVPVDWASRWSVRPGRVTLPPYPFERQRLWLPSPTGSPSAGNGDHLVGGQGVMPGAASLELVCSGLGASFALHDVRWRAPLPAGGHSRPRVRLDDGRFTVADAGTTYLTGGYDTSARLAETVDLAEVRARCGDAVEPADLYATMRAAGLEHGERMRVLRDIRVGDGVCLARIEATERPLVLDGAFQALAALPGPDRLQVPAGFAALVCDGPLPTRSWVVAEDLAGGTAERRFRLRITDDGGRVLLRVDDLRVVSPPTDLSVATDPCVYLRPEWTDEPVSVTGAPPARIRVIGDGPTFGGRADQAEPDVVLVHLPAVTGGLADEVRASLHEVLRAATEVLGRDPAAQLRVVVGCPDERPAYTAVSAALRTLSLEHSGFSGAVVRGGGPTDGDLRHVSGPPEERVHDIRYAAGVRQVRRMVPFRPGTPVRQTGGVYVVIGGTGAIGRHLAAHLVATRAPAAVVLVGRTAPSDHDFAFVRADVTVQAEVRRAVTEVRDRYGRIDGVIHAAGTHDDARALAKSTSGIDAVLAPKVFGLRYLVDALGAEPPEFFALCSSIAGRTGNLGQVDYAYANAFLDEFAAGRPGVVSICWPLWADGGMAVDDATRRLFARRWGSEPLGTAEALHAFDRVASGSDPVVAVHRPTAVAPLEPPADPRPDLDLDLELRGLAAGFLLVDPEEVDPDTGLLDLGFDSISLTGLVNQVNDRFGLDLLPTVLYERPTLTALAAHLRTVLPTPAASTPAVMAPVASTPVASTSVVATFGELADVEVEPGAADVGGVARDAAVAHVGDVAGAPVVAHAGGVPSLDEEAVPADAVAVVGVAGVLPGSPDLDAFWQHLVDGDDLVRAVPSDRTDLLNDPATAGIRAGFLDDVRSFDAARFGIAPARPR